MDLFLGYLFILLYGILLFIISKLIKIKNISRKILHFGIIGILLIGNYYFESKIHFTIICAIALVLVTILSFTKTFDYVNDERKNQKGLIFYCISLLTMSLICLVWKRFDIYFDFGVTAICCGDGLAAIFGTYIKSRKIYKNKTIVGCLTCALACMLSFIVIKYLKFNDFKLQYVFSLAILVMIAEIISLWLDNFSVPFTAFFGAYFLMKYGNYINSALYIGEIIFIIALLLKAADIYGALGLGVIAFIFYYCGGYKFVLYLVGSYIVLMIISIIRKLMKKDFSNIIFKTKSKDIVEVFVNGIVPIVFIILYKALSKEVFLVMSLCAVSANFVDSLASDIGTLSNKKPYDIFRRTYVEPGLSGGMSLLGSVSSLIGAIIFSLVIILLVNLSFVVLIPLTIIMMFGSFMDSMLGSLAQIKYKCNNCGIITECPTHCNMPCERYRGFKFINNDMVNMLSSIMVGIASISLLLFI